MVDFIRPTPRNRFVGLLADAASRARDATGIFGDFLLGGAPETLDNLSYGVSPVQFGDTSNGIMGAINGMRVDPGIADLTGIFGAVPAVGKLGRAAGMEALSAVNEGMMGSGIMSGLLSPVAPRFAVAPGKATSRAQRMQDMGLEGGWYRGGPKPQGGRRTGPWYTKNRADAEDYARRFGDNADVREYAVPKGDYLEASGGYTSKLAHDVASILENPYYGEPGVYLASQLRTFGPDEGISGGMLWQALESQFGNDGAAEVIEKLGAFRGARGMTAPGESYVFKSSPVRDAQKALFEPSRSHVDDIYGHADPALLGLMSAGALGLLARNNQRP